MKKFIYEAYTKEINGKIHYVIKKFEVFPEQSKLPPTLVSMGMHQSFDRACRIANVISKGAYESLKDKLGLNEDHQMDEAKKTATSKSPVVYPFNWLFKLKWVNS